VRPITHAALYDLDLRDTKDTIHSLHTGHMCPS